LTRFFSLIINPVSGGYSEAGIERIRASLRAGGVETETLLTGSADDAQAFARDICRRSEEPLIAACGGDGTVNGVINGMEPGKGVLAVIPSGTANVLARELSIRSVDDSVSRIIRGFTRQMTIGVLHGERGERRFILMAGVGLDGEVVEKLRMDEKRRLGKGAYLLSAARRMVNWNRDLFEAVVDGNTIRCHSLVVCNASRYGGGFVLAPQADIFSPGLQALCVTGENRAAYARLIMAAAAGRVKENSSYSLISGREFSVSGDKAVQLDGDYFCRGPVRISSVEGFTNLIV
jgi:diacylglycerol kinase (ATP)